MAVLGALSGTPGSFWWVQRGPSGPSQMWATMFNHVQPVFNQFGAARAAYGQIRPNMAIFGSKMAIVGPYGRNVMHTRLNIAPLNISDKFCIKIFVDCNIVLTIRSLAHSVGFSQAFLWEV